MSTNIAKIALKGTAMAIGIAVIVMSTLKTGDVDTGVSILGLGLTASAFSNFQD